MPARTLRGWLAGEALPPYDQLLGLMAALPLDARLDLAEPLRLDGTAMQASERPALLMDLYRACADFIALSGPAIEAGRPPRAAELRRISAEATRLSAEIRRFRVTHRPFLGEGWIGEGQIGEGQNEDAPAGSSAGASSVDRLTA